MNILALETSQPDASLCLHSGGSVPFVRQWHAERNHDAYLFPALRDALNLLGDEPLDLILVGAGPGSYGGVRVALAAAVGLSMVRGAPVVALPSWLQLTKDGMSIFSDAKRGGWTLQPPDGDLRVVGADELRQLAADGAALGTVETREHLAALGLPTSVPCSLRPDAEGLVASWLALSPDRRQHFADKPAEPIYVRPPHITAAKHKPWEIRA